MTGHEGGALMMGLVSLHEEDTRELVLPYSFPATKTQQTEGHLQTKKWALIRQQMCWHFDHPLPSLQNCEK